MSVRLCPVPTYFESHCERRVYVTSHPTVQVIASYQEIALNSCNLHPASFANLKKGEILQH
eukprot:scaffold7025_cov90-Skeletonema_dohrnii-CCMP3373.AAC.1